jgi:hypothetical protein
MLTLKKIIAWIRKPDIELGEFSLLLPNAFAQVSSMYPQPEPEEIDDKDPEDHELEQEYIQPELIPDDGEPELDHQSNDEEHDNMARTAGKEKVFTVQVATHSKMGEWALALSQSGFTTDSFQYNADGEIVSATCTKNGRQQVITPELFDAVTG